MNVRLLLLVVGKPFKCLTSSLIDTFVSICENRRGHAGNVFEFRKDVTGLFGGPNKKEQVDEI